MTTSRFSRRRFLMAAGAGLAPLTSFARSFARPAHHAANVCAPGNTLLSPADLSYLGSFKMPNDGVLNDLHPPYYLSFSEAALTGRTVGGVTTLLIQGSSIHDAHYSVNPQIVELSIPTPSINNPPRATEVRKWYDIYNQLEHKTGDDPQSIADGEPEIHGIHIDPDHPNNLWVAYKKYYSQSGDPSHFLVVLNNDGTTTGTSYGPWRHGGGAYLSGHGEGATMGPMCNIPSSARAGLGGKRFLSMGYEESNQGGTAVPFGVNAHAWNPPASSDPRDPLYSTAYSIADTPAVWFDKNHRMARLTSNFHMCEWQAYLLNRSDPITYPNKYDMSYGGMTAEPDGTFSGGPPPWSGVIAVGKDMCSSMVWVETGTKHGLIYFGQLVDTVAGHIYEGGGEQIAHAWYGPPNTCPHGQQDPTTFGTGPGAGSIVMTGWIVNPADLARVAAAEIDPWDVVPAHQFQLTSIAGASNLGSDSHLGQTGLITSHRSLAGAWYDEVTKRIYLGMSQYDTEGCCAPVPRIHVFQVLG